MTKFQALPNAEASEAPIMAVGWQLLQRGCHSQKGHVRLVILFALPKGRSLDPDESRSRTVEVVCRMFALLKLVSHWGITVVPPWGEKHDLEFC